MASPAVMESKTCECACECTSSGSCSCVCSVPCAFNSENKTVQWTCDCKCSSGQTPCCKSTFQIRCNNKDQACSATDTELFTAKCQCGEKECLLQVRKCKGCEVLRVECDCRDGASCGGKSTSSGCCKEGKCGSKAASSECCKGGKCGAGGC